MIFAATFLTGFINLVILVLGLFLILLVLIQRGKGGGLAGAFGGMGGSSAFGSRAGDAFTRITIVVAAVWFFLIMVEIRFVQPPMQRPGASVVVPGKTATDPGQPGAP